jgi:ribose transport system permease protein
MADQSRWTKTTAKKQLKAIVTDYNFNLVIALVALGIVMGILSPYFWSGRNFMNIGLSAAVVGIMAAGLTVSMLMGAFDLSQYATATLSAVVIGMLLNRGFPVLSLVVIGLGVGVICGLFNSLLVTVFRISPIIATLGTQNIFRAICYILTSSKILTINNSFFSFMGRGFFLAIPMSVWILAFVYVIVSFILKLTPLGRKIYAVGANSHSCYLAGINVKRVRMGGLIISALTAAIAGIISASQVSAVIPSSGVGTEMDIVTAVLIGGLSLSGGKGKLSGTFLGLLILTIINNGLTLLSIQSYYQMLVRGIVLVLAVLIDSVRGGGYK